MNKEAFEKILYYMSKEEKEIVEEGFAEIFNFYEDSGLPTEKYIKDDFNLYFTLGFKYIKILSEFELNKL